MSITVQTDLLVFLFSSKKKKKHKHVKSVKEVVVHCALLTTVVKELFSNEAVTVSQKRQMIQCRHVSAFLVTYRRN